MTVYTLAPGFLHQHFSYTRAALLGQPNVEVEVDKQTALTQEVLLYDSQAVQPVSVAGSEVTQAEVSSEVLAAFPDETVVRSTEEAVLPSNTLTDTRTKTKSGVSFFGTKIGQFVLSMIIGLSFVVALVVLAPTLYYQFFPADTQPVEVLEEGTPLGGQFERGATPTEVIEEPVLPPQDPTLPTGMWLVIPKIGVRTPLDPNLNSDEALQKGVWIAPDYGMPGDKTQPMILAAHRYGWKWWWQSDYWQYHSFYLLPDLQPGDMIEVISDQRKYYYEIYAGEEGDEITDYTADMILYTCKFLNSPIRHFRYARLIDVNKNTQG